MTSWLGMNVPRPGSWTWLALKWIFGWSHHERIASLLSSYRSNCRGCWKRIESAGVTVDLVARTFPQGRLEDFRSATGARLASEFHGHRRKEVPLVHSMPQVLAVGTASGISGRPDPDSRHGLSDSVDYLLGNALGFCGARLGPFEVSVKL